MNPDAFDVGQFVKLRTVLMSPASHHFAPSPDGAYVATTFQSHLLLRSTSSGQVSQTFSLPRNDSDSYRHLKGYSHVNRLEVDGPLRVLVSNKNPIHVFKVYNAQWKAVINGVAGNTGNIARVSFGFNEDNVVVFSDS